MSETTPQSREILFGDETITNKDINKALDNYFDDIDEDKKDLTPQNQKELRTWFAKNYKRLIAGEKTRKSKKGETVKISTEFQDKALTASLTELKKLTESTIKEGQENLTPELFSRYGSQQEFKRKMAELQGSENVVVFVTFDLDNFKKINDSHTHEKGDELLKTVAKNLEATLSLAKGDVGIRFSGDEYGMFLTMPQDKIADVKNVLARMITNIEQNSERPDGNKQTLSVGYTVVTPEMISEKDLFKNKREAADKAGEISKLIRTKNLLEGKDDIASADRIISSEETETYFEEGEKEKLSYIRQVMRPMQEVLKEKSEKEIVEMALQCYEKLVEKK
ncbi:MAG: GGDEF domain-containing protein [Patescibacteria group bacterium]|nr:GGDEF domain-containing protein [Patescibacteria group bacterium]